MSIHTLLRRWLQPIKVELWERAIAEDKRREEIVAEYQSDMPLHEASLLTDFALPEVKIEDDDHMAHVAD